MKSLIKKSAQDRELKQSDESRAPPERFGQIYSHVVQSTTTTKIIEPEILKMLLIRNKKDKWLATMKTEIESLNSTEIWDLVAKEKGEILFLADGCTKSNMTRREKSISLKK